LEAEMKDKNTPAFPFVAEDESGMMINMGMTLRDYFAAKALQGLISTEGAGSAERYAEIAYKLADAMLKAREA
jgi:hypothetical protein